MSYAEIARILGVTEGAVRDVERRGLKRMRRYLENKGLSLSDVLPDAEIPEQLPEPAKNCFPCGMSTMVPYEV